MDTYVFGSTQTGQDRSVRDAMPQSCPIWLLLVTYGYSEIQLFGPNQPHFESSKDSTNREHSHHCRKFSGVVLLQSVDSPLVLQQQIYRCLIFSWASLLWGLWQLGYTCKSASCRNNPLPLQRVLREGGLEKTGPPWDSFLLVLEMPCTSFLLLLWQLTTHLPD